LPSKQRESWDGPQARRLAKRLERHAGELTRFLWHDQGDATNKAAERAIRPAVVIRKISGGSRRPADARATAILLSVLRTAQQQNRPMLETSKPC
jgi:transposase